MKENFIQIYSKIFPDGKIVESFYNEKEGKTGFLLSERGEVSKIDSFEADGITYFPPPATNILVSRKFVKLPSAAEKFESESLLLKEIQSFVHDYVEVSPEFEHMTAAYILFSWVYDLFEEVPYLRVLGDYGSGKSRFLKVVAAGVYRAIIINGMASPSSMFRIINETEGTIIVDEGDMKTSETTVEMVKIFNGGFQKGIPIFRSETRGGKNKSFDPVAFNIFCPKVIGMRNNFQDEALESRFLSYPMETSTRKDIAPLDNHFEVRALALRNKLVMFRFLKLSKGINIVPLPEIDIDARLRQIIIPLYSAIEDPEERKHILEFISKKQAELTDARYNSFEGEVFRSLLEVLKTDAQPTMKKIAVQYNQQFGDGYSTNVSPKKIGTICTQIFHLEKGISSNGVFIQASAKNTLQIQKLKTKYNVAESQLNIMDNVDVPEAEDSLPVSNI